MNVYIPPLPTTDSEPSTSSTTESSSVPDQEPPTSLTVSPFPSTTLGVLSIPIANKPYTIYDTPGMRIIRNPNV